MKQKKPKASALVFTLIILSIILISAISVAAVTVTELRSGSATGQSVSSFQAADSGAELVLNKIYSGGGATIGNLGNCSSGTISGSISSGAYAVTFYDLNGAQLTSCGSPISSISSIKSSGNYYSTTRAINVAVAAGLVWQNVTNFNNGWGNLGSSYQTAQCAMDNRTGLVYLRGLIHNSSATTGTALTLPSACVTPLAKLSFPNWANSGAYSAGRIDIDTSGNVIVQIASSYAELDGIFFSTN